MKNVGFVAFVFIVIFSGIWYLIDTSQRSSIKKWCSHRNYEVIDISRTAFEGSRVFGGPFYVSGKGYSIFKVKAIKLNKSTILWFRYSIFGKDVYEETDKGYIEMK